MSKTIIGVVGPGEGATDVDLKQAEQLGRLIANKGWTLLTGGRNVGVMDAASKGAHKAGGVTIGILPDIHQEMASEYVDIPICTGMGSARNNINVLSSDVVVACGTGAGTSSEIMLSLKNNKPLLLLNPSQNLIRFLAELSYPTPEIVSSVKQAGQLIKKNL